MSVIKGKVQSRRRQPVARPDAGTQASASGRLGPGGQGIALESLANWVPVGQGELQPLVDGLTAADWLTEAAVTDTHLTGRLTERVLPLTCRAR